MTGRDRHDRYRRAGWWTGERLVERFEGWVATDRSRTAVDDGSSAVSFGELWDQSAALAADLGLAAAESEIVIVLLLNDIDWMRVFIAILQAGQIPATIPITTTEDHLRHAIYLVGASKVITSPTYGGDRPGELAARAAEDRAEVITIADGAIISRKGGTVSTMTPGAPAELAHVMFTSSTTGPPKAVMHSEDTLATLNRQFAERFDLTADSPVFMPSPLGHSVGAIHGARLAMWTGAPLVLQQSWDPGEALALIDEHRAAFTAAATPFLADLLDADWPHEHPKMAGLRWFLCGGAQVPPAMVRRSRIEFPDTFMTPLWGMTEGGLTTCLGDASTSTQLEETVGVGLPDLEVRVLGDDGVLNEVGTGELVMRGPGVFIGYLGQDDLYRESLTADGFFRTGDIAAIGADGYVAITGRVKDLIIRGGVNISPVMTENTLAAHPDMRGVAVIGWPDERLGERLCAVVIAHDDLPSLDDLIGFCEAEGLERRFHPERLVTVNDFPRTAAGKIRKQQLRTELLAEEGI